MKNYLLAAAAAIALLGGAQAAAAKGAYVGAYGGINWGDVNYDFAKEGSGTVVGVAVGTWVDSVPGLRIEADLSNRNSDISIFDGCITADDNTWALVGNAVYDFQTPAWPVHPYALVGLGYGSRTVDVKVAGDIPLLSLNNSGFVWQAGFGVNTQILDGVTVGAEYRFFDAPNISAEGLDNEGNNQAVIGTVRFAL